VTITQHTIDDLHADIVIKYIPDDYMPSFKQKIKEIARTTEFKGFRKGHVPINLIKNLYGNTTLIDVVYDKIDDDINEYLTTHKIETIGKPLVKKEINKNRFDFNDPCELSFTFELGFSPTIDITFASDKKLIKYNITITDELIEEAIQGSRKSFGQYKESDQVYEDGYIMVRLQAIDENNLILLNGIDTETLLIMPWIKDVTLKSTILQLKINDTFIFDNIFENLDKTPEEITKFVLNQKDVSIKKLPVRYQAQITMAKQLALAEINEEFFEKLFPGRNFKTIDEMKDAIREDYKIYFQEKIDHQLEHDAYHYAMDNLEVNLPINYLNRLVEDSEEMQNVSSEERENYINKHSKWIAIQNEIVKIADINIKYEDVKQFVMDNVKQRFKNNPQMTMPDEQLLPLIDQQLLKYDNFEKNYNTLMDRLISQYIISIANLEEKHVTLEEFKQVLENHAHHH